MEHFNINKEKKSNNLLLFASLFSIAFIVLSFGMNESYLYAGFSTHDSAWYMLCAKAWLAGLQPYVDFSDSKGPLLWVFFMIAHKIHAYSFIGVFWIVTLLYTITLWFNYKSFNIFLKNKKISYIATFFILAELFIVPSCREFLHTEDFSLPFISISLYYIFRLFYQDKDSLPKVSFIVGICFGAIFMIKFYTVIISLGLIIALVYKAKETKYPILNVFLFLFLGGFIACLPFLIYFSCTNNLLNFFNEYILTTFKSHTNANYTEYVYLIRFSYYKGQALLASLPGLIYFIRKQTRYAYLPLILFIPFWLSEFSSVSPQFGLPTNLFFFFTVLGFIQYAQIKKLSNWLLYILTILFLLLSIIILYNRKVIRYASTADFFTVKNETNTAFAKYNYLIAQKPHARLLYKKIVITDWGFQSESLPACKYFAPQYGETQEMTNNKIETVLNKKADFVCSIKEDTVFNAFLTKHGYIEYYYENPNGYTLFSKYKLKEPAKDYCLSPTDVLLKRRPWLNEKK